MQRRKRERKRKVTHIHTHTQIYTYHIPNPNAGQGLMAVHIPQGHDEVVHAHVGAVGEEEAGEDDLIG